ncbi:glutamate-5-semialdehyde dehydrogenase [Lentilactobacillus buchneri]|uniref:Gamma-glutamyl phosphate reductase n=1 Tax=Lentilactobacillus buchneri subsp. silagei CD034 TaxID=1071400 RepID=J9W648_LENBU|nr:glutamate-5-semialdehyde dehydrogenase [Lentilactobacillus buchneri]MCC6101951.1 glutamate-5-semialdehyde dehydrogenase [Lactobacillus sp.]AFS01072.1 Gamma-glutamyl phosphate reductase [Lentilactobacillus buchneri subsp. silagei CD034]MCT2901876.1 glutamate-5-semialdehyde dehydrogenase [Lentilactobacillus buchneri]MCT3543277.1 glutamate-5-semialdehyde dehydrogenase [Lentilactobacillus buchneri]MCT3545538.1 glutamate-5-semialdehyde dehydrogenase [Lentilactobacillus buchneri]
MNDKLIEIGKNAKAAAYKLNLLDTVTKNRILNEFAIALGQNTELILSANQKDLANATDMPSKFTDRLKLTSQRITDMAEGLRQVAGLADPIGDIDKGWENDAGLNIEKKRVPLGVIAMIFEARPNVTVDASALTFKSGNAVILRGGKEAINTNLALAEVLRQVLKANQLDENAIQILHDTSHDTANDLMHLNQYVDVLIPRGGAGLINAVVKNSTVPVIETGAGNCHVYVDKDAELQMAIDIVVNAKVQRPSVCNAAEKLLIHRDVAESMLPAIAQALEDHGVELRGDEASRQIVSSITPATQDDWSTEYNDLIMAVKVVDDEQAAIEHINQYSTGHSEVIISDNYQSGQEFLNKIDSACVYVNASTRFTDGFEFGFGAEIGISTQKLHARGPMGLNELTTTKYVIRGNGQVRK